MFHLLGFSINSHISILGCLQLKKNSQFSNKFSILGCLQLGGDVVALQLPLADHKVEVLQLLLRDGDRRRDPLVFHLDVILDYSRARSKNKNFGRVFKRSPNY